MNHYSYYMLYASKAYDALNIRPQPTLSLWVIPVFVLWTWWINPIHIFVVVVSLVTLFLIVVLPPEYFIWAWTTPFLDCSFLTILLFFLCLFNALNSYIRVILDKSYVFSKEWIEAWNLWRTVISIFLTILESKNSKPCNLTYLQCWEVYCRTLESSLFDFFNFYISNSITRFNTSRVFIFSFPSHSSLRNYQIPNADL